MLLYETEHPPKFLPFFTLKYKRDEGSTVQAQQVNLQPPLVAQEVYRREQRRKSQT